MKLERQISRFAFVLSMAFGFASAGALGCKPGGDAQQGAWRVGDKVDVEWKGSWWKGEILSATGDGKYKIHYTGWAASWDEVVTTARLRAPTSGSNIGTETKP